MATTSEKPITTMLQSIENHGFIGHLNQCQFCYKKFEKLKTDKHYTLIEYGETLAKIFQGFDQTMSDTDILKIPPSQEEEDYHRIFPKKIINACENIALHILRTNKSIKKS